MNSIARGENRAWPRRWCGRSFGQRNEVEILVGGDQGGGELDGERGRYIVIHVAGGEQELAAEVGDIGRVCGALQSSLPAGRCISRPS